MKEKNCYIGRNGIVVGLQPQLSKGFKKIGYSDYPLDIHMTATQDQLENGRLTITVNRLINNELYETVIPNIKLDEFPIQFTVEEEVESLDYIAQQEDITMQRAREKAVVSVRHSRRYRPAENQNHC